MLECAIREKGLMEHINGLDSQKRVVWIPALRGFAYAAAACIVALVGISLKLGHDARLCGDSFAFNDAQRGSSVITALIESGQLKDARRIIGDKQKGLYEDLSGYTGKDPEYIQLNEDIEELRFLDCICLLRQGNYFSARRELKKISDDGGIYADEAKALLEKL